MAANSSSSTCQSEVTEVMADSAHFNGSKDITVIEHLDPYFGHDNHDQENVDDLNRNLLILATILPTVPNVDEMSIIDTTIESILQLQQKIQVLQQEVMMVGASKSTFHTRYRSN